MKRYKVSITVGVYLNAKSKKAAQEKWEDMAIKCEDPNGKKYASDVWDFDIVELDDLA